MCPVTEGGQTGDRGQCRTRLSDGSYRPTGQASTHRVHLPHDHGGVFGSGGEFGAVVRELAEPNLVTVFGQNLLSVTGELLPER